MNGSSSLIKEIVAALKSSSNLDSSKVQVVICPPAPFLSLLQKTIGESTIKTGAQNSYTQASGAYTGEISATMLKEVGVSFGIVGHSERRSYFGETDKIVQQKAKILLAHDLQPIICVGESLEQRENGEYENTILKQLNAGLAEFTLEELTQCVIAYEPIWAIGTGKTASPEQANQMHEVIRGKLTELTNEEVAKTIPILYGGSVNAKNAQTLLGQPQIDGALVGGASLKPEDFITIIHSCP